MTDRLISADELKRALRLSDLMIDNWAQACDIVDEQPNGELFNFCCPKYTIGGECEDYGYHESEENCCDCFQAYWDSPAPEDFGKGGKSDE